MELEINDVEMLLPKKVPKHGKVSGISKKRELVRVIIPNKRTKMKLIVSNPEEILVRTVTPEGKILGLSNYIEEKIYILDQDLETLKIETGLTNTVELEIRNEEEEKKLKRIYEYCEEKNIDFKDYIMQLINKLDSDDMELGEDKKEK